MAAVQQVVCGSRAVHGPLALRVRGAAGLPPDYGDLEDLKESYHALMPLRCLLLKTEDPAKWAALSAMEAHNALRRQRGDIWPSNELRVLKRLRGWGMQFHDEEVHTVCGILEVNAFEVGGGGGGGGGGSARALYSSACLLAHACTPSTTHTDAEQRAARPLTVRAAVPHRQGDLLSLCYAYTLQGTLKRREHIKHSKFFDCVCRRCADPTELGTFASAFRCPKCCGRVLSSAPLDPEAAWRCGDNGCSYNMPAAAVQLLLKSFFRCPKCFSHVLSSAPLDPEAAWRCGDNGCSYNMPAAAVQLLLKSFFRCPKCFSHVLSSAPLDPEAAWRCGDNGCSYNMPAAAVQLLLKSFFRCPKCFSHVLSSAPLDPEAAWRCGDNGCSYNMPAAAVQLLLKRLTDEFEQIDANDVPGFETFLHKYRNVIHSGHYLRLSALHSLSQLYGKSADYLIHEMPERELLRKVEICRELMTAFDVIEPGYSRLRGVTLYELHAPLMILTTRKFEAKAISKDELRTRLKEIVGYLSEAALILGFEPSQSSEGLMASAAREALKKIKTWEKIIGKIS
ncbi:hypothetical protein MSG28_013436 [Choristoneura fumiferana]|uniref:Uncharacterized protein n=1 Tax=Choristoneura fumiferana TaxID=7141 RepID=A0ACC0KTC6_CHOFU|nr:hypothetical protein MSG28_013436 [Choristoneura fumiferana]